MSVHRKNHLPDLPKVQGVLSMLFDRAVKLTPVASARTATLTVASLFVFDAGTVAGAFLCDVALSAGAAAALALLPASLARDAVKASALDESLRANFYEVANILAASFSTSLERHVRLRDVVYRPQAVVPADAAEVVARPSQRLDFDVGIPGYGAGCGAFLVG